MNCDFILPILQDWYWNALPARTMGTVAAEMHKTLDSDPSYCSKIRMKGSLAIRSDSIVGRILKIRWIMAT